MNLSEFYLFSALEPEHIKRLEEISAYKKYKKGQLLFLEGERPDKLHLLTSGVLKVYKTDPKGNEVVIKHFHPVELIAELANLEHIPFPASAAFETDGEVLAIDYSRFESDFLQNPALSLSIIKSLTLKLRALNTVISQSMTMTSAGKVARFIFDNEALFLELKQHKIASILNITPETMSRVIRKLRESGAIEKLGNKFNIVERDKLRDFFS